MQRRVAPDHQDLRRSAVPSLPKEASLRESFSLVQLRSAQPSAWFFMVFRCNSALHLTLTPLPNLDLLRSRLGGAVVNNSCGSWFVLSTELCRVRLSFCRPCNLSARQSRTSASSSTGIKIDRPLRTGKTCVRSTGRTEKCACVAPANQRHPSVV